MIKIYTSPSCGRCHVLKTKLDKLDIPYQESTDTDEILDKTPIRELPIVLYDDTYLTFTEALSKLDDFKY